MNPTTLPCKCPACEARYRGAIRQASSNRAKCTLCGFEFDFKPEPEEEDPLVVSSELIEVPVFEFAEGHYGTN